MGMRDFMAGCTTDVALNTDEAADRGIFAPADIDTLFGGQGLPLVAVMGGPRASFAVVDSSAAMSRQASAVVSRTQAREIINRISGVLRDPDRQDTFTMTSGPWEGVWVVQTAVADIDDTLVLDLVFDRPYAVSGARQA